jgi:hypothetical protein
MDAEIGRPGSTAVGTEDRRAGTRRLSTETKAAYKTTEFLTRLSRFRWLAQHDAGAGDLGVS